MIPQNLRQQKQPKNTPQRFLRYFYIQPVTIPLRILSSLVPPLWWVNIKLRRIYTDLLIPMLMFISLWAILQFGHQSKDSLSAITVTPFETITTYSVVMALVCWGFCKVADSKIHFAEMVALLGYSFGGHIFTLLLNLILFDNENDDFFYLCMVFFGGMSALRFFLAFNSTIKNVKAIVRFLIATVLCTVHLLFEIFIYFSYMHQTFRFGEKRMDS